MTDYDADQLEAIQAVLDRVQSYQDGAPKSTVESELTKGFDEAGIEVDSGDVTRLANAIEAVDEGDGQVHAVDVLG